MPVMLVVSFSPFISRNHSARWERFRQRTIPIPTIFQPHALGDLPAQVEDNTGRAANPEDNPGQDPTPTQVRIINGHDGIIQQHG